MHKQSGLLTQFKYAILKHVFKTERHPLNRSTYHRGVGQAVMPEYSSSLDGQIRIVSQDQHILNSLVLIPSYEPFTVLRLDYKMGKKAATSDRQGCLSHRPRSLVRATTKVPWGLSETMKLYLSTRTLGSTSEFSL